LGTRNAGKTATTISIAVVFENDNDRSLYARLAFLVVGWVTAGVLLYALSTVLPVEVLAMIAIVAWAIVRLDTVSRKNKSLASLLCWITCLLTAVCGVALRITHWHDYVLVRLIFVGVCLGAGLILLDRREDA
jgi:hypothetical protein